MRFRNRVGTESKIFIVNEYKLRFMGSKIQPLCERHISILPGGGEDESVGGESDAVADEDDVGEVLLPEELEPRLGEGRRQRRGGRQGRARRAEGLLQVVR